MDADIDMEDTQAMLKNQRRGQNKQTRKLEQKLPAIQIADSGVRGPPGVDRFTYNGAAIVLTL